MNILYGISYKSNLELLKLADLKVNKKYKLETIHNKILNTGRFYWDEYTDKFDSHKELICWDDDADDDDDCNGGIIRLWRAA